MASTSVLIWLSK